jgi:hypothetical protein
MSFSGLFSIAGLALFWGAVACTLAGFVVAPWFLDGSVWGDDLVRFSVRLALLYYGLAASLILLARNWEWSPPVGRVRLARWFWFAAYCTYLIHLAMAMHYYHHWSHADAFEHTRDVAGVGEGIYISHLFTLFWGLDLAYWLISPEDYAARSAWIGRILHAFMIFIIFNGTVIYETGFIRWAGIGLLCVLGVLWVWKQRSSAARDQELAVYAD